MSEDSVPNVAGNVPSAAPSVPSTEPAPGENWKERFAGLQAALQKRLQGTGWGTLDAIPNQAEVMAWKQAADGLPGLREQLEGLSQEKLAWISEREALSASAQAAERKQRLLAKIIDVAPAYGKLAEYIPYEGDDAAQDAAIAKFVERMSAAVPQGAPAGKLPPSAQPPIQPSLGANGPLFARMQQLIQNPSLGTPGELEALREQWYKTP